MNDFLAELRRRHVYRVAVVYVVVSWLLLQVADIVFGAFEAPAWVMKAVLAMLVIGLPLALVLAWAFELTPQGVRRTEPVDSPEARPREHHGRVGRLLNIALAGALVASLGFIGWQQASRRPAKAEASLADDARATRDADARKSIAVLPLVNSSGDPGQDYFSDGLSEELIARLGRIADLKVIGRSSSFQFKGTNTPGTEVGRKLGVANLLEGSVRQQAKRVRIVVALVRAGDGSTLWTQTYDRQLDDIFAVQSEIAQAVAMALQVKLGAHVDYERPPGGSVEAYQAVLRAHAERQKATTEGLAGAIELYREAVRLEPDYAAAHAYLGMSLLNLANLRNGTPEAESLLREARAMAERAVALAPDYHVSQRVLGFVRERVDGDVEAAGTAFRRAHELAPHDGASSVALARFLLGRSQRDQPVALMRDAVAREPLRMEWRLWLASTLESSGHPDEALATVRETLAIAPDHAEALNMTASILVRTGRYAEAEALARRGIAAHPDYPRFRALLAYALDGSQRTEEAWAVLDEALALMPNNVAILDAKISLLLQHGRAREALPAVEQAIRVAPHESGLAAQRAIALITLLRLDEAERVLREAAHKDAGYSLLTIQLAEIAALRGDAAAARTLALAEPEQNNKRYGLALVHAVEGDMDAFNAVAGELVEHCTEVRYDCMINAAALHAFARQPDRMFALLDEAAKEPGYRPWLASPFIGPYLHDPRYIAHLAKFGMSPPSPVSDPARAR